MVALAAVSNTRGAAPPVSQSWVKGELSRVWQIDTRADQAALAGDFALALRLSRRVLAAERVLLGEGHWLTVNARREVERWGQLARLPEAKQQQAGAGLRKVVEGEQYRRKGQSRQAEIRYREALALTREALGDEHPETGTGYSSVALCLRDQGKAAEAMPLFRKALEIHRKALGEDHPVTATSYTSVAQCLHGQRKDGEALSLYRKALEVYRKAMGEDHPATATSYNNVAVCLADLGKSTEALLLHRKALVARLKAYGENHPDTAQSYNGVAACLHGLGKASEALPLNRKALMIHRKVSGEEHPATARSTNNVAVCLESLGKYTEALPLLRKVLLMRRNSFGEDHPDTARSYNGVGACLQSLGKTAEAVALYRKALEIQRKVLGEEHPATATCYRNVALCLKDLGKAGEALPLHRKALEINRKVFGDHHQTTARSYHNLALCLQGLEKGGEALPLFRKAIRINREAVGEDHPQTGDIYRAAAYCLQSLGKGSEALDLARKALEVRRKIWGEEHPLTAQSHRSLAFCLNELGKRDEAMKHLRLVLLGMDVGRHSAAPAGFDRSLFAATQGHPRLLLACLLAREGKAVEAWKQAEAYLARGLLEVLSGGREAEVGESEELAKLDARIVSLLVLEKPTAEQEKERNDLVKQQRALLARKAKRVAEETDKLVWSFSSVQKHLDADTAVLLWLDSRQENFACVLRKEGEPTFVRLAGSGKDGAWTADDWRLARRVHAAVRQAGRSGEDARKQVEELRKQRLAPVQKYLKARGNLPTVRHLVVIPVGLMAAVPVELLAEGYIVSYAPSANHFARQASKPRALRIDSLVALGDPVFQRPTEKNEKAPGYGLLLRAVLPGGNAARSGLRVGDVLMRYNGVRLRQLADLKAVTAEGERVPARAWREGEMFTVRLASGPLGVRVDERPIEKALADWRQSDALVRGAGVSFPRLPGTRYEVEAISSLVGREKTTLLLGSAASEKKLDRLLRDRTLGKERVIHLATHGQIHPHSPEHSALVLAADALPDPVEEQRRGRKVQDGFLRVRTILDSWKLDADLVVLSACETGLGKDAGGEGLLGFAQAFLEKGARSVVLSRWKVDDDATALLMLRFYENLLGKRERLKKPLGRAEALAEAKKWLRSLDRKQAEALVGRLAGGKLRGTIDKPLPEVGGKTVKLPEGDKPFAHPFYWAAFVLVGDPS
jgi:tetratricopeptide (TPR) repeat protein